MREKAEFERDGRKDLSHNSPSSVPREGILRPAREGIHLEERRARENHTGNFPAETGLLNHLKIRLHAYSWTAGPVKKGERGWKQGSEPRKSSFLTFSKCSKQGNPNGEGRRTEGGRAEENYRGRNKSTSP